MRMNYSNVHSYMLADILMELLGCHLTLVVTPQDSIIHTLWLVMIKTSMIFITFYTGQPYRVRLYNTKLPTVATKVYLQPHLFTLWTYIQRRSPCYSVIMSHIPSSFRSQSCLKFFGTLLFDSSYLIPTPLELDSV